MIHLKIYVVKQSKRGQLAIQAITGLLESENSNQSNLQIVDVFENPAAAEEDRIMVTPTLIRIEPEPKKRLIGDLTDLKMVKLMLDL